MQRLNARRRDIRNAAIDYLSIGLQLCPSLDRDRLETEFEETAEMFVVAQLNAPARMTPTSYLGRLLQEHHDLGEAILDVLDGPADPTE